MSLTPPIYAKTKQKNQTRNENHPASHAREAGEDRG
jgi:hypothetical protein